MTLKHLQHLLQFVAMLVIMIVAWGQIADLDHETRELLLQYLAVGCLIGPPVLFVSPRSVVWYLWAFAPWCMLLGVCYSGDMGASGHMFTGFFLSAAAFLGTIGGLLTGMIRCARTDSRPAK